MFNVKADASWESFSRDLIATASGIISKIVLP